MFDTSRRPTDPGNLRRSPVWVERVVRLVETPWTLPVAIVGTVSRLEVGNIVGRFRPEEVPTPPSLTSDRRIWKPYLRSPFRPKGKSPCRISISVPGVRYTQWSTPEGVYEGGDGETSLVTLGVSDS